MWVQLFTEMSREMVALRLSLIPKWQTIRVNVVVLHWLRTKRVSYRQCGAMFLESKRATMHFRALRPNWLTKLTKSHVLAMTIGKLMRVLIMDQALH